METMSRCDRQLTLDAAADDTRRASEADHRPPHPTSWTHQRRRRSAGTRPQLMSCVSGQHSPSTPTNVVALLDSAPKPSIIDPAAAPRHRHSPRPSKYHRPALSVYSDQILRGSSTLVSAAAAAAELSASSTGDSGVDVNSSASFDEVDRRQRSGRGRSRSTKSGADRGVPLTARQITGEPSDAKPEVESGSKRSRKSRSQSPAALWHSISSSTLVRSLSRRRGTSRSRRVDGPSAAAAADAETTATDRSKFSSLDTDSDCENREASTQATQEGRRHRTRGDSFTRTGGSLTGLGITNIFKQFCWGYGTLACSEK